MTKKRWRFSVTSLLVVGLVLLAWFVVRTPVASGGTGSFGKAPSKLWERATLAIGREDVLDEVEQMYTDLVALDWKAFAGHFIRGAKISTVTRDEQGMLSVKLQSVGEYIEHSKPHLEGKRVVRKGMRHAEVRTYGSIAQVWTHFEAELVHGARRERHGGIDAINLHYVDGQWKIVSIAYTSPW